MTGSLQFREYSADVLRLSCPKCGRAANLLLQRKNDYAEAADYWRRYLANECQSDWAARARRSLKFCEMQIHSITAPIDSVKI
jgi:hypothetical protein